MDPRKKLVFRQILEPFRSPFWDPNPTKKIPKKGLEIEPEKQRNRGVGKPPILLPSVAPNGTPQAKLLKKLAFGTTAVTTTTAV